MPDVYEFVGNASRLTKTESPEICSLHIRVRAFAVFGDEPVDPRRYDGQRYRAELEHGIVESANVEFETRSLPALARSYPRHFAFYVADPISSIRSELFSALAENSLFSMRRFVALL